MRPTRPKILVTRRVPPECLRILRGSCSVSVHDSSSAMPRGLLLREVADKEGLLCLLTDRVDAELLAAAPRLRAVSSLSVGLDHVDLAACAARGVAVTGTPGVLTETTADFAWALLLGAARRVTEGDAYLRAGRFQGWDPLLLLGTDVHGKTLGVVGFGRIGRAVARRARGFSMRVLYHDHRRAPRGLEAELRARRVPLDELLRESDFVTLHVSLNEDSRHLIDARALGLMKPSAFLVNTARGAVVDERALVAALAAGRLRGAALDVFEREPRLAAGLLARRGAVLTPHLASASLETRARMTVLAASGLLGSLFRDQREGNDASETTGKNSPLRSRAHQAPETRRSSRVEKRVAQSDARA